MLTLISMLKTAQALTNGGWVRLEAGCGHNMPQKGRAVSEVGSPLG